MSEEVFRIIITIGVILIAIAFVVQAIVMAALGRALGGVAKKMDETAPMLKQISETLLPKAGPLADHALALVQAAKPTVEKLGPFLESAKPVLAKTTEVMGTVKELTAKATEVAGSVNKVAGSIHLALEDSRPQIVKISEETAAIVHTGREQVERLGDLLEDAANRARHRLEQIDNSVDNTVGQIGQVGETMKRGVMRPVREVNGLSAGIAAAMSTLVHGRKSSVDHATQDEELFI